MFQVTCALEEYAQYSKKKDVSKKVSKLLKRLDTKRSGAEYFNDVSSYVLHFIIISMVV